jgi:hypothetical protein
VTAAVHPYIADENMQNAAASAVVFLFSPPPRCFAGRGRGRARGAVVIFVQKARGKKLEYCAEGSCFLCGIILEYETSD